MKRTIICSLLFTGIIGLLIECNPVSAQIPDTVKHSRFQFAQTYVGLDLYNFPAAGTIPYLKQDGTKTETNPGYRVTPRVTIGGPHFWGHAAFFINIPTFNFADANNQVDLSLNPGIETGLRIYPWSIYQSKLSPFAGLSWSVNSYSQETDAGSGPVIQLSTTYLQAGLTWQTHKNMLQIGLQYQTNSSFSYPLSKTRFEKVQLNPLQSWISYKYLFDTTNTPGETYADYRDSAASKRRNVFSVGLGLSSSFGLQKSDYNSKFRPYLEDPIPSHLSPDISLGYHLSDLNASLRLSYRRIVQSQNAYEVEQKLIRNSISFETIKFLGDYHGFVPFAGLFAGPEFLAASETDRGDLSLDINQQKWSWGLSLGWDIRPTPSPPFVLRTNLRYTPFLSLPTPAGNQLWFDHLELDFIQVVVYPQRMF